MSAHFDFLKKPLAKDIAVVLVLKLVLLVGIRLVWFGPAAGVTDDATTISRHLFGTPSASLQKSPK
ncbi:MULTISPECIES: cytochrome oxidase putative small subunit CydP [unclassified Pseudomonas]|uniref:cytochrome oxidase putative small subunit CydP n=1 Tax=unclassified Pseudomonas TaxID=196821 RepID=UPI000310EF08|nr:cytochrome oxidase putative small subunit CydP [Pseudomonas sp. M47T1]